MSLGIEHSKKVLADLGAIAVAGIEIAKKGGGLGALKQIFVLIEDVKGLISEAPLALPELKDVDSVEAGQLATAAYDLVKSVISAVTSK